MNATQLAAFAAVAEAGSFTRGGERLMVSQPAVSLQVAELETALGTKLFDRLPRGVRLTAAGETLLQYARRLFSLEREAEAAVAGLKQLRRGRLTLGASLTIGSYLLPAVLGEFQKNHPDIELEVQIANTRQIEQWLSDHQIDIGLTEGLAEQPRLVRTTFSTDRLLPIAPPEHPILSRKRVTVEQFCREPLILREIGSGTREVIEDALNKKRLKIKPALSLGSAEAIKRAVQAGLGLSILSELTLDAELAAGSLVVVPVIDLNIRRPLHLLRSAGRSDSPATAAFVKQLSGS